MSEGLHYCYPCKGVWEKFEDFWNHLVDGWCPEDKTHKKLLERFKRDRRH